MKNFSRCLLLALLCTQLIGWGPFGKNKPALPTCIDAVVTNSVVEIANKELYKSVLRKYLTEKVSVITISKESEGTPIHKEYSEIDYNWDGFFMGTVPTEYFIKFTEVSPTAAKAHEQILNEVKEINATVTVIRPAGERPDIQLVGCQAQLAFSNGKGIPIEYTAQTTADGQIWVEVQGL